MYGQSILYLYCYHSSEAREWELVIYKNGKMIRVFLHATSHFGYDCDPVKDPIVFPSELHTVVYSLLFMYTVNSQKFYWYKVLQINSVFRICTSCIIVTMFIDSIG